MRVTRRKPLWAIILASLLPQPILALDSGVNAMQAATELETQSSITAWAYHELANLVTGFRDMLEPILPRPVESFNMLDAQIAAFIAEGQQAQARIKELIEAVDNPAPQEPTAPIPDQTMIAETQQPTAPLAFYGSADSAMLPDVKVFDENGFLLNIDTSKGIDVPDLTIDPRDGGNYASEIPLVDSALEVVQLLQDQVPAPIQTAGNDLYNSIAGMKGHDNP